MDKNVANLKKDSSSSKHPAPMNDGLVNPAFFKDLQESYQRRTGYNLVLSDTNGSIQMGLPDCDKFPCMRSCRECRESIVMEALRTGKVCIDNCHEGYTIWGLPISCDAQVVGGLIVIGGESGNALDNLRFQEACGELYKLMQEQELLPASHLMKDVDLSQIHRFVYRDKFDSVSNSLENNRNLLINHLQTAHYDEAEQHFQEIKASFIEAADLPLDVISGLVGDLIYEAKRKFIHAGMDSYACTAEAGALMDQLADIEHVEDVHAILNAFFDRFVTLSSHRPKDQDDLIIQRATTYLEEHLRDNLTRESVAKAVGVSPSHFSRLIREKKGRTFTDLLNQYRIERAAKMLVRSSNTLAHIATETGFCDQSYFSKVFRRYKDLSPAQYRDQHRA